MCVHRYGLYPTHAPLVRGVGQAIRSLQGPEPGVDYLEEPLEPFSMHRCLVERPDSRFRLAALRTARRERLGTPSPLLPSLSDRPHPSSSFLSLTGRLRAPVLAPVRPQLCTRCRTVRCSRLPSPTGQGRSSSVRSLAPCNCCCAPKAASPHSRSSTAHTARCLSTVPCGSYCPPYGASASSPPTTPSDGATACVGGSLPHFSLRRRRAWRASYAPRARKGRARGCVVGKMCGRTTCATRRPRASSSRCLASPPLSALLLALAPLASPQLSATRSPSSILPSSHHPLAHGSAPPRTPLEQTEHNPDPRMRTWDAALEKRTRAGSSNRRQ